MRSRGAKTCPSRPITPWYSGCERGAETRHLTFVDRIRVLGAREAPLPALVGVRGHAGHHLRPDVGVALREARRVAVVDPEQVMEDEHLAVGGGAGADPDDGDLEPTHELLTDRRRDGLEDEREAARLLE